jgi:hypothetical protein
VLARRQSKGRRKEPKLEGSNPATVGSGEENCMKKKFCESSFGGAKTLSLMTPSIITLSIRGLFVALSISDIQHK